MLLLLHNIDTKNNKQQENSKAFNCRYHIQDIKYVQHKNVNIAWEYWIFPRQTVSA